MIANAGRLQSLIDSKDYSRDLLLMRVQLAAICDAVKSTVPQEMWGEIIEKLDEAEQHSQALDTTTPSIRPSSSTTTTSSDLRSAHRHRGRWGPLPGVDGAFAVAWTVTHAPSVASDKLKTLHEMPSQSSDWAARQPHARGWLG